MMGLSDIENLVSELEKNIDKRQGAVEAYRTMAKLSQKKVSWEEKKMEESLRMQVGSTTYADTVMMHVKASNLHAYAVGTMHGREESELKEQLGDREVIKKLNNVIAMLKQHVVAAARASSAAATQTGEAVVHTDGADRTGT